jgi:DNA-binding LacI/PurR family transcriptional regulator
MRDFRKIDPNDPLPRYYQLYSALLDRILSGEFPPGALMPTERELGEQYEVSRITVIKALDLLELEGHVERQQGRGTFAAQRQEKATSASRATRPPMVAFIMPPSSRISYYRDYVAHVLQGALRTLAQEHYPVMVVTASGADQEREALSTALAYGAEGILVYSSRSRGNTELYAELTGRGFPLVQLDRYIPNLAADRVVFNDHRAGFELTSELIRQGHRRVAFVPSWEQTASSVRDRFAGYRHALETNGLVYDEDLVWIDLSSACDPQRHPERNPLLIQQLLEKHINGEQPTALMAANYEVTEVLLAGLTALDERVRAASATPVKMALATISYDELPANTPFLTVIGLQRGDLLGSAAAELIAQRIQRNGPPGPQDIEIDMEIVACAGALCIERPFVTARATLDLP